MELHHLYIFQYKRSEIADPITLARIFFLSSRRERVSPLADADADESYNVGDGKYIFLRYKIGKA